MALDSGTRGIRNCNPGNIRYTRIPWLGLAKPPSDGTFCVFTDAKYGIRAAGVLLKNYYRDYKLDTVAGLIDRWAPPVENKTDAYVAEVSKWVGVDKDATIEVTNPDIMAKLLKGIIHHENGQMPYDDAVIRSAVEIMGLPLLARNTAKA